MANKIKTYTMILLPTFIILLIIALSIIYHLKPKNYLEKWWDMPKYVISDKSQLYNYDIPKIIWSYWHNENIPKYVNLVLNNRKVVLSGWEIKVLNDTTLKNYICDLPQNFNNLYQSHKADWIRLALIEKYGGCWLDATVIVNSLNRLNQIYNESLRNKSEFTGFYTPSALENNDPTSFIESWFIMAPKNSRFISEALKEFNHAVSIGLPEYKIKVLKEYNINNNIYNKTNNDVYLSVYASFQIALNLGLKRQVNIILYNSYHTMYKLHYDCWNSEKRDYDSNCIVNAIKTNKVYVKKIPYIKLTKAQYSLLKHNDISSYF